MAMIFHSVQVSTSIHSGRKSKVVNNQLCNHSTMLCSLQGNSFVGIQGRGFGETRRYERLVIG